MSPEEFGKAVYCPARRSVKEGSHGAALLPLRLFLNVTHQLQALYAQRVARAGED
jgi:hypothetical protein